MQTITFHYTPEDAPYLHKLKSILAGRAKVYLDPQKPVAATELVIKAKQRGGSVATTSDHLLGLLQPDAVLAPKVSAYQGSLLTYGGVEFLILPPLKQLVTMNTGEHIMRRYLSKLLAPEDWSVPPPFKWELFDPGKVISLVTFYQNCEFIAVDIETVVGDPERSISCISFTGVQFPGPTITGFGDEYNQLTFRTVVVPFDSEFNVSFVRTLLNLNVPKAFQNGKYDIAYLMRFNCVPRNYLLDTINLFHSWLSELPKDLGFISAYLVRNYRYHKNDGKSGDKMDYYGYNAMDTYTTALAILALLELLPDFAWKNYEIEFPIVYPSILMEHTGIKQNEILAASIKKQLEHDLDRTLGALRTCVANREFNPASPTQVVRLFHVLGSKDITSSKPQDKDKVASRHPLNKRIVDGIVTYRETAKLNSSYFKEGVTWNGRVYYAVNPHGTDTGRLASRESQFWCGLQIQNIPSED